MIIDTSALLAILTDEPDAARFAAAIASAVEIPRRIAHLADIEQLTPSLLRQAFAGVWNAE